MSDRVRQSGRHRSYLVDGCLSDGTAKTQVEYQLAGPIGGIVANMDASHASRVKSEISAHKTWMDEPKVGEKILVTCHPLNKLLKSINQHVVDFWSLDTEGSEPDILKSVDFDEVMFGLIFVECNTETAKEKVKSIMTSRGFVENVKLQGKQDTAWQNPAYCRKYSCSSE